MELKYLPEGYDLELVDKGYAKVFVNRSGEAITKGNYKDYIDIVALNQAQMEDKEHLRFNYYLAVPYDKNADPDAMHDAVIGIQNNTFSCRGIVAESDDLDDVLDEYFEPYDGSPRKVKLIMTKSNKETESLKYSFSDKDGPIFTSLMRDYSTIDVLNSLDDLRSEIVAGMDAIIISHIPQEIMLMERKFSFINGFESVNYEDIKNKK